MNTNSTNWQIEVYETHGNGLACKITSPQGRTASAELIGFDGRLSKYRTQANIHFGSESLRLTETLVDRMIAACRAWSEKQRAAEPEFNLTHI